jgi:hypothetical protein
MHGQKTWSHGNKFRLPLKDRLASQVQSQLYKVSLQPKSKIKMGITALDGTRAQLFKSHKS